MIHTIEKDIYLIPVPTERLCTPTGQYFRQTQGIPVKIEEKNIPPNKYFYPHFNYLSVEITAGGKDDLGIALDRIRWRMVYKLQDALKTLEDPNSSMYARLYAQETSKIIQQFISLEGNRN